MFVYWHGSVAKRFSPHPFPFIQLTRWVSQTYHVESLIKGLSEQNTPVAYLYLVGGFAESKTLQARVKGSFEKDGLRVIIPMRPQLMVVKGAVLFGLSKGSIIQSRVARSTYGFGQSVYYNSSDPTHVRRGSKTMNGKTYVNAAFFQCLVKQGDNVQALSTHTSGIRAPVYPNQKEATFELFSSNDSQAKFVDEPGMERIGEVSVPCVYGQQLRVAISFGNTEMIATATNVSTPDAMPISANIKFNFNSL